MNNSNLLLDFMVLIKDNDTSSHALGSNIHKEGLFLKASSTYMQRRWGYDHEYYQRMIDRSRRMMSPLDCGHQSCSSRTDDRRCFMVDGTRNEEDGDSGKVRNPKMLWPERAKDDGNEGNTYQHPNPNGQEDHKILCLSFRDGTDFSIPISDATNSSEVMQVISQLDNRDKRVHFIKGSTIPVTLLDGREVIVSHEPTFAKTQQEPITLTDRDSFMITSRHHNKNTVLAHVKDD